MAEVTAFRNNALPYPVYGLPYVVELPIYDNTGQKVAGAAGLDAEISKNGDSFADCSESEVETGNGWYHVPLTSSEMTADAIKGILKTSTTDAKDTLFSLHPRKLVSIRSGTAQGGASSSITLDSGASSVDDFYNGMIVVGTLDGAVEVRMITDYNGSTKVATVTPDFVTTPDSNDTFVVYLPEGVQIPQANVVAWGGTPVASAVILAAANIASDAITAAKIAADAITSAKVADGALTAAKFASGAFDAVWTVGTRTLTSFGTLVADVATAVWGATTRVLTAGTNIVLAKGTGVTGFNDLSAAQVNAEADQALADVGLTTTVTGRIDVAVSTRLAAASYTAPLDAAGVRAAIGLAAANLDTQLAAIAAKTTNLPSDPADASDIASAFSSVSTTLSTIAGYLDTEIAAIKAKTDNLPGDPADASDIASQFAAIASTLATIAGFIDTEVAAIKAKTDNLPADPADASDIAASFTSVNSTLAAISAFIDTEIAAIKAVTDQLIAAQAEPSSVPAANATPLQKLAFIAALARNAITQTAGTQALKNDAGSGNIGTAATSDDGSVFTREQWQ